MLNINETLQEREQTHGNFHTGALIFNDILKHIEKSKNLDSTHKHVITMIATKLARILNGNPHEVDHWRDIAGYATLGGRLDIPEEPLSEQPLNAFVELPVIDTKQNKEN